MQMTDVVENQLSHQKSINFIANQLSIIFLFLLSFLNHFYCNKRSQNFNLHQHLQEFNEKWRIKSQKKKPKTECIFSVILMKKNKMRNTSSRFVACQSINRQRIWSNKNSCENQRINKQMPLNAIEFHKTCCFFLFWKRMKLTIFLLTKLHFWTRFAMENISQIYLLPLTKKARWTKKSKTKNNKKTNLKCINNAGLVFEIY